MLVHVAGMVINVVAAEVEQTATPTVPTTVIVAVSIADLAVEVEAFASS